MIEKFEVGKYYRFVGKEHSDNWNEEMDSFLDGKAHICISTPARYRAELGGVSGGSWSYLLDMDRIEEVKMKKRREFKVGDRVFYSNYGWGEVSKLKGYGEYTVIVEFGGLSQKEFTADGRYLKGCPIALFRKEPEITEDMLYTEEPAEKHVITLDGKEIELSEESYQAFKKQFVGEWR